MCRLFPGFIIWLLSLSSEIKLGGGSGLPKISDKMQASGSRLASELFLQGHPKAEEGEGTLGSSLLQA